MAGVLAAVVVLCVGAWIIVAPPRRCTRWRRATRSIRRRVLPRRYDRHGLPRVMKDGVVGNGKALNPFATYDRSNKR